MKRLVMHIGTQKTGTTALQSTFAVNRVKLLEQGVLYPVSCCTRRYQKFNRHIGVREAFVAKHQPVSLNRRHLQRRLLGSIALRNFDRELRRYHDAPCVFISDEGLTRNLPSPVVESLLHWFASRFSDVDLVMNVREPYSFIVSAYSQYIKTGGLRSWEEFRDHRLKQGLFLWKARLWENASVPVNLRVSPMRPDSIAFFADLLDISTDNFRKSMSPNSSLSKAGLEILRHVNIFCAEQGVRRRTSYRRALSDFVGGPRWQPPAENIDLIYEKVQPEIDEMLANYIHDPEDKEIIRTGWTPEVARKKMRPTEEVLAYENEAADIARVIVLAGEGKTPNEIRELKRVLDKKDQKDN